MGRDGNASIGCARPLDAGIVGQQILDEARGAGAEAFDHRGQTCRPLAAGRGALQFSAGVIQADILGPAVGEAAVEKFRLAVGKLERHAREIEQAAMLQRSLRAGAGLRLERAAPVREIEFLADHPANDSVMAP
jgi:hypothetical protein